MNKTTATIANKLLEHACQKNSSDIHFYPNPTKDETKIYYRVRPSVYAFIKLCTRILNHADHVPLTSQEREMVLLQIRKLTERFL